MGGVGLVGSRGKGPSWPVSLSGWHPISGDTAGSSAVWALGLFQGVVQGTPLWWSGELGEKEIQKKRGYMYTHS